MRRFQPRILSTVSFAALAAAGMPGIAQAQSGQEGAQDCSILPTQVEREDCRARVAQADAADAADPSGVPGTPAAQSEETILITGSRIARPNFDTVEPSVTVSSDDIENRGFETLGQALNELPAFGIPGSSPVGGQSSYGPAQSFVNFLGLGDQRTLTLVNGNRFVGNNTSSLFGPTGSGGQVDLNLIPTALIDRVEVIAIGGAPIYGSDAIAGTVNIILKRNFEGIQLDGQYGISEYGDVGNYRIRGLIGQNFGDGRGNVTLALEYQRQPKGLLGTDRDVIRRNEFFAEARQRGAAFENEIYNNRRVSILSEFGIPLRRNGYALDPNAVGDGEDIAEVFGGTYADDPAYYDYLASLYPTQAALYCALAPSICGNFTDGQGNALRFDAAGNLVPIDFGTRPGPSPYPLQFFSEGGNGWDLDAGAFPLLSPLERYSAVGLVNYELTDNIRFSGEAWFTHSEGAELVDQPVYASTVFGAPGTPGGNFVISLDNPFITAQARPIIEAQALPIAQLGGARGFYLSRANTDFSTRFAEGKVDVMRFVGGLEGTFDVGGNEWRWDVVGNYGRSRTKGENPEILAANLQNAVDAVLINGAPACRPGAVNSPFPSQSSTCAPLNVLGRGPLNPAALDYITGISTPRSVNKQWVATASLSGELFQLPGGGLGFAIGYEHRNESFNFDPGPLLLGGPDTDLTDDADGDGDPTNDCESFTDSACITAVVGSFNTDELFAEFNAPIISPSNDVPGVYMLELKGAFRYVDHSTAGGDPTWTVGARYAPIRDITFRGNYTRSIRAPAVGEIAVPKSPAFFFAVDPCDSDNTDTGPDPATRQANCAAAGIPANFDARAGEDNNFPGIVIGNPDLLNEKAEAWSVGAVLSPTFLPGFTASFDWVDIRIRDAISFFGSSQVLSACYDSPDFPNNQFCDRFTRNTTPGVDLNQLTFVETTFFNADVLDYEGLLIDADYRFDTPFLGAESRVNLSFSAQYLSKLEQASAGALPTVNRGLIGNSEFAAVGGITYSSGDGLTLQLTGNYIGPAEQSVTDDTTFNPDRVDDFMYFNAAVVWDVGERYTFRISVDNITSANFPSPGPAGGGVITYFPSILGTYFRAGATVRF
jgi:iron complex outermembrane recepter protein